MTETIPIPVAFVGPIKIVGSIVNEDVQVPLATFETPLWSSTKRGAAVSARAGGIRVDVLHDKMTRSILLEADSSADLLSIINTLPMRHSEIAEAASQHSRFAKLLAMHPELVGNLAYIRCEFSTGDASGHNMVTQAADNIIQWLLKEYPSLRYVSISANICVDKKNSAINGILGRGKYVIAETTISRQLCQRYLKTTPEKIIDLNNKKNLLGSIIAGSVRSANSHYANLLLGFYLATGQDAANIVEGSQGFTFATLQHDKLYFSVTLPNVIVGTVGNGKHLAFVQDHLRQLGCLESRNIGDNARRLAAIVGATVLCGELSCLAAQTNIGELTQSHLRIERAARTAGDLSA